jgi:hypothetical protein
MVHKPAERCRPGPLIPTEPESHIEQSILFPFGFTYPFLSLPPEVRRKIYRPLFRSTIPIYPTIASHPNVDATRGCEVFKRPSFPTKFLRTNRQIHAEASAVLWGDNQVVLQFPLN